MLWATGAAYERIRGVEGMGMGDVKMLAMIGAVLGWPLMLLTLVWSGVGSAILYKLVDLTIGLRASADQEREGLDLAEHGERAYSL